MNLPRSNVNNLLYVPNTREYADEMYNALLQFVSAGKTVAVLTQSESTPKLVPLMKNSGIEVYKNKQSLKRLIFICCENVDAAIKKLFDLHDWTVKPNIIVIDLYTFIASHGSSKTSTVVPLLHPLVQCIVVLFNMLNCLKNDKQIHSNHHQSSAIIRSEVFSIVVLQKFETVLTSSQVELITELYYGSNTFDDFEKIVDVLNLTKAI